MCLLNFLEQLVQVVDIGAMMLTVVEFHQVSANNRFKRTNFVGQVFELNNFLCNLQPFGDDVNNSPNLCFNSGIIFLTKNCIK